MTANPTGRNGDSDPVALVRELLGERNCRIVSDRGHTFGAQCPAHDDEHPSLVVSRGDDGRALIYCHAGCTFEAVCDALGIEKSETFVGPGPSFTRTRVTSPCYVTSSSCSSKGSEDPSSKGSRQSEIAELLEAWKRGQIQPVDPGLGQLPPRAGKVARLVYDDLRLLLGLRLADRDTRPLLYSCRFGGERTGEGHAAINYALQQLERWQAIRCGTLRLGDGRVVRTVLPDPERAAMVVEGRQLPEMVIDAVALDPAVELPDDAMVNGADAGVAGDAGVVAAGDAAATGTGTATAQLERDHGSRVYAENYNGGPGPYRTVEELIETLKREFDATEIEIDSPGPKPSDESVTAFRPCGRCRGQRWWRLRTGGPATCGTCHPPVALRDDEVEWLGEPEAVAA